MYAIIENNQVLEWPIFNLNTRFPHVSFPNPISDKSLPQGVVRVVLGEVPDHNPSLQRAVLGGPELVDGRWIQPYSIVNFTEGELQDIAQQAAEERKRVRAEAYRTESDPLFFQEQRGEVEPGTWLAKVAEIKSR
jgi:hypothetical protein